MKQLRVLGIVFLVVGAVLFVVGVIPYEEKHEAKVLGVEMSVTEEKTTRIPIWVSGGCLALGAVLLVTSLVAPNK